jgi:acyl-CoA hydrolase
LGTHREARVKRLVDALEPGTRVFVPTLTHESSLLLDELRADPDRARDVSFVGVQFPGIDRADYLSLHGQARQTAFFMSPSVRRGLLEGRADLLSLDYPGIARHLASAVAIDVAIAQLTPPDADGWCSAGLVSDFVPLVWARAARRVAHLNPRVPRTQGSFRVHRSELDFAVEADTPLLAYTEPAVGVLEERIGRHVATLVRDGDTLQFGIGSVPLALAAALADRRSLKLHSGMVSGGMRLLWEAGSLDRDARIVTGVVLGDESLHDFAGQLEALWLTDVSHTHDVRTIASISRFVAINTAVEIDLFGQVNSERSRGTIQAGAGGLPPFAQGALASLGGRIVICLPSMAKNGSVSRIVPALDAQALCTLPRYLADAFVTEHGIAEVRGLSLDARAQALIAIAAPEHRAALSNAWDTMRRAL